MKTLPDRDEQIWLIEKLVDLISTRGEETYLLNPIIGLSSRFFPDRIGNNKTLSEVILKRLMGYADLSDLEYHLVVDETQPEPNEQRPAAWFNGIDGKIAMFGVNCFGYLSETQLVGGIAHEVAHAYRNHHNLVVEDPYEEELLTDLTMSFLGFDLIAMEASNQYVTDGTLFTSSVSWNKLGYLTQQSHAFLLAIHFHLKEYSKSTMKEFLSKCNLDCRKFVDDSLKLITSDETILGKLSSIKNRLNQPEYKLDDFNFQIEGSSITFEKEEDEVETFKKNKSFKKSFILFIIYIVGILFFISEFRDYFELIFTTFIISFILFAYFSIKLVSISCSKCGEKIDNFDTKICPNCQVEFKFK